VYNSYFLIIYKPSSLIISPQTFSTQLGAGTAWFCLSQYAIPICTLSACPSILQIKRKEKKKKNNIQIKEKKKKKKINNDLADLPSHNTQVGEKTAQTLFDQCSRHARDFPTLASGNWNYGHERTTLRRSPPRLRSNQKPH